MNIAAVVGLPKSGKTTLSNIARELEISIFSKNLEGINSEDKVFLEDIDKKTYENLIKVHNVNLITLLTPIKRRYKFSDKSITFKKFIERDKRLLDNGMGRLLPLADYNIVNDGNLHDLSFKTKKVFSKIFNFEKIFIWTFERNKTKTRTALLNLFPTAEIYEGKDTLLAHLDLSKNFDNILNQLKTSLLNYFKIKEEFSYVIRDNVLKFGLNKKEFCKGNLKLSTSFKKDLRILTPIENTIFFECITKSPKRYLEDI